MEEPRSFRGAVSPVRRRFCDDSPFFQAGHELRETRGVRPADLANEWRPESPEIVCGFCGELFWSLRSHEEHVGAAHANSCETCGAGFALERWLTQHVQEAHDGYFAALVRRGTPMYSCVAVGCQAPRFGVRAERDAHLSKVHGFPPGGLRMLRRKKIRAGRGDPASGDPPAPPQLRPAHSRVNGCAATVAAAAAAPAASATIYTAMTDTPPQGDLAAAQGRRWVCKHFVTQRGCRYGAECRFLHPAPVLAEDDGDLASLTAAMSGLSTRAPPPIVSFGRRGRGSARMLGGKAR